MKLRQVLCCVVVGISLAGCARDPEQQKQEYLAMGNKYFERGKFPEASLLYRRALQVDRRYAEAYYRLGLAALKMKSYSAASNALYRAFELNQDNLDAFRKLAEIHFLALTVPQPARPQATLDSLVQLEARAEEVHPTSPDVLYIKGKLLSYQGKSADALRLLRQAREMEPEDMDISMVLLAELIKAGEYEEGEGLAHAFLDAGSSDQRIYVLLYLLNVKQNKLEEAEKVLRERCEAYPKDASSWIALAAHRDGTGKSERAGEALDRILEDPETFPNGHEIVGDYHLMQRDYDLAIRQYREGLEAQPDRARDYQLKIVGCYLSLAALERASTELETLLEKNPEDAEALGLRGILRLMTGDEAERDSALEDFQKAVQALPNNYNLRLQYGNALQRSGDRNGAETQFREVLRLDPGNRLATYSLIDSHLNAGEYAQAQVIADSVIESQPYDMNARLGRAAALIGVNDFEKAREELKIILQSNYRKNDAIYQLARLNLIEKQYSEAKGLFTELAEADPPDPRGVRGLVTTAAALGDIGGARTYLKNQLEKTPDDVDLLLAASELALRAGDTEGAMQTLTPVLEKKEQEGEANYLAARVYLAKSDLEQAKVYYQKAMEAVPPVPEAFYSYGTLLAEEHRYQESRKYLQRCLELKPDHANALNNMAFVLAELGADLDVAITYAQRAVARNPDNADYADTLGYVYVRRKLNQNAIDVLSTIVTQHPDRSDYRYHLGLAYYQSGEEGKAVEQLKNARAEDLTTEQAEHVKQILAELGG